MPKLQLKSLGLGSQGLFDVDQFVFNLAQEPVAFVYVQSASNFRFDDGNYQGYRHPTNVK